MHLQNIQIFWKKTIFILHEGLNTSDTIMNVLSQLSNSSGHD